MRSTSRGILGAFGQLLAYLDPVALVHAQAGRRRDVADPLLHILAADDGPEAAVVFRLDVDVTIQPGQDLLRIERRIERRGDRRSLLHAILALDEHPVVRLDVVRLAAQTGVGHLELAHIAFPVNVHHAADLGDDRLALGRAGLEQLLDARQTLGDVFGAGHTTRVERAQRELRAGLADRLGRDDADRLAHLHHAAARQVTSRSTACRGRSAFSQVSGERTNTLSTLDRSTIAHTHFGRSPGCAR